MSADLIWAIATVALLACMGAFGWSIWIGRPCGKHDYSPRHDTIFFEEKWRTVYVCDVCSHCGAVVERAKAPE